MRDMYVADKHVRDGHGSQRPEQDAPSMDLDEMIPEVLIQKVVGHGCDDYQRDESKRQKCDPDPVPWLAMPRFCICMGAVGSMIMLFDCR